MMQRFKSYLKQHPALFKLVHFLIMPTRRPRPRWWVRNLLNPQLHSYKKRSYVYRSARMDVFPFNKFELGIDSTIEDFSCVNNAMGPVRIGNEVRIGLSNTIIGPVTIGDFTILAQNVVLSGLNHGFQDITIAPSKQTCTTAPIKIGANCWIGANAVITSGVELAEHTIVAAGSVVTKSFEGYCVIAGSPARLIKRYNFDTKEWESC